MGRGRRFLGWLRKKLAIRRKKKSRKNKKNKKDGVKRSPSQESLAQHHQDTGSGNSRPEGVCADVAVQQGEDTSPPELEPDILKPQQGDDVSIHQIETQPLPLLPPSEVECEKTASPQPPELELTTTKLGNTAFQVVGEQGVASKAPEKFQYTRHVFDDEFLRRKKETLDRACQRRRQLLEAIKEKQRVREEERAAARMRKITGNVPSYDDLEVAQQDTECDSEEENVAEEESEAAVVEEENVLEEASEEVAQQDMEDDSEEGNAVEEESEVVEEEKNVLEADDNASGAVLVEEGEVTDDDDNESVEGETSSHDDQVLSSSALEPIPECQENQNLFVDEFLKEMQRANDVREQLLDAYHSLKRAKQEQRDTSVRRWMEFYSPSSSGASVKDTTTSKEQGGVQSLEYRGSNTSEEKGSSSSTGDESLGDRPKLAKGRKSISFNEKVEVLQFYKDQYGQTSSTEVIHTDLQDESDSAAQLRRAWFADARRPVLPDERVRLAYEAELKAAERMRLAYEVKLKASRRKEAQAYISRYVRELSDSETEEEEEEEVKEETRRHVGEHVMPRADSEDVSSTDKGYYSGCSRSSSCHRQDSPMPPPSLPALKLPAGRSSFVHRRKYHRKLSTSTFDHESARLAVRPPPSMPQSNNRPHRVNPSNITLPPIVTPGRVGLVASTPQPNGRNGTHQRSVKASSSKLVSDQREHRQPTKLKHAPPAASQMKPRPFLPALPHGPITCQPVGVNAAPRQRGARREREGRNRERRSQ